MSTAPRVLLYQCDDREPVGFIALTCAVNAQHASAMRWGYRFDRMVTEKGYDSKSYKIFQTRTMLREAHGAYDFVVFMDTDAWVESAPTLRWMVDTLAQDRQGVFSRDPYVRGNTFVNSGSFVLRVNEYTLRMYDRLAGAMARRARRRKSYRWHDQELVSRFVHTHRNDFDVYEPDVVNTPVGKVIRHSWIKEFKDCVHKDGELVVRLPKDTRPFPNTATSGPLYLYEPC
jgi:hypothetical protein